jgi:hypothetical protein
MQDVEDEPLFCERVAGRPPSKPNYPARLPPNAGGSARLPQHEPEARVPQTGKGPSRPEPGGE